MRSALPAAARTAVPRLAGHPRAWLVFLLLGCLLAVIAPFMARFSPAVEALPWILLPAASAVAVVVGMRRYGPRGSWPWLLVCAGFLTNLLGTVLGWSIGWIWLGDPFVLRLYQIAIVASYVMPLAALVILSLKATGSRGAALLDAGVITVGVAMPLWTLFLDPILDRAPDVGADLASTLALPVIDLFIVGLVVRIALDNNRAPWLNMLSASYVAMFFSDIVYLLDQASGRSYGAVTTVCWLGWAALVGAAMLHPSLAGARHTQMSALSGRVRVTMFLAPALLSPLVSVLGRTFMGVGEPVSAHDAMTVTALTVLLAVLLVLRLSVVAKVAET
ncbi:hypothetical protein, partial [Planobispora rosea]|uniref:hypothetical protein n=2 Tax=Planobispora rosea TaxID=35762 RepID=UPI001670DD10